MSRLLSLPSAENILRTPLDNGLTVLVRENHASPVVVLEGSLRVGGMDDPDHKTGLSSMTANMLSRGTANHTFAEWNEIIESVGGNLSITSDTDSVNVGIACLREDFPTLVRLLADGLRRPAFPQQQFDLLRRQKLVRLQERDQDPSAVANIRLFETLYGGHPYGRPSSGYTETVRAITLDDLRFFHSQRYGPQGAIFGIAGDVHAEEATALIAEAFGDWHGGTLASTRQPVPVFAGPTRADIAIADKVQSEILLGALAVPRTHPDFEAIRVANTVLGVFGMMGRLGEVVREQQGLAYYAYSSQDADDDTGVWTAGAGVNPADVEQALSSMLNEIARLRDEPVGEEELRDSQDYLTGVLPLTLEMNEGVASTLLSMEWYGLGLDYLLRYNETIRSITPEDVQRVAKTYFAPEQIAVVTAGPG